MRARKYTRKIDFYQVVKVPNGYSGNTVSEELIASSWCDIKTGSNNNRISQRLNDLGIIDPVDVIIIKLRHRNDIDYNAINQFIKYRGENYIIRNAPTNIDLNNVDIEIIAVRDATNSVSEISPI